MIVIMENGMTTTKFKLTIRTSDIIRTDERYENRQTNDT